MHLRKSEEARLVAYVDLGDNIADLTRIAADLQKSSSPLAHQLWNVIHNLEQTEQMLESQT